MADFRYFTLKELCASAEADRRKIDNFPPFDAAIHLEELTRCILEPLRAAWGSPIRVTSGYRCDALNRIVGGAATSVHRLGWAADLQPANGKMDEFISFTKGWLLRNGIRFDQLLDERSGKTRWMHIGIRSSAGLQRGEIKVLNV